MTQQTHTDNKDGRARRGEVDMTEGGVFPRLIYFALPFLASNMFQQLYNMTDVWVVGNYVGDEAFSAVGTVAPVVTMLIGTFMGFASGAGVVISQYYGAANYERVSAAVHTSVIMTAILSVVFTATGVTMTPFMLRFMKTPPEVFPESLAYLTIYFSYIAGLLFYNMGAGIMRAVGNSARPFYYLVAAAILNVALDLILVIVFGMGVKGVAWATVISQGVAAVLTFADLLRTDSSVKIIPRRIITKGLDLDALWKMLRVGIPAAVQMAVVAFSNVFVQSYINQFGKYCMGGWTAYHRMDQLIFLPMQSMSMASTTFVGQNLGRGNVARARRGVAVALMSSITVTAIISAIVVAAAPALVRFFNSEPHVVEFGTMFLRWLTPFYVLSCANQIYAGSLRGAGDSRNPVLLMIFSFVVFRQIYLYVVSNFISNTPLAMGMSYPAGWFVCSLLLITYYYRHADFAKARIVSQSERRRA